MLSPSAKTDGGATKVMLKGISSEENISPSSQPSLYEMSVSSRPETRSPSKVSLLGDSSVSFKQRITNLEISGEIQSKTNDYVYNSLDALAGDNAALESRIKQFVGALKNEFDVQIAELKRIYDHRFELQSSENSRNLASISGLRADMSQLQKKLGNAISRIKVLEGELGLEPNLQDFGEYSSPMKPMADPNRPHTTV